MNRLSTEEGIQMAVEHMKGCSASFVRREIQIKATRKFDYTSKMATILEV